MNKCVWGGGGGGSTWRYTMLANVAALLLMPPPSSQVCVNKCGGRGRRGTFCPNYVCG